MQAQRTTVPARAQMTNDPRVVIVDSYNFSLTVRNGHIVIRDGKAERKLSRIDATKTSDGIARIIILSHVGSVSMEVMRWAAKMDVPIFQVSRDGEIGFCSPGLITADARMFKRQILAQSQMPNAHVGLEIVRELLTAKLAGQQEVLRLLGQERAARHIESLRMLSNAREIRSMLGAEGNAAIAYWKVWQDRIFVPWDIDALKYIPAHWSKFNDRAGTVKKGHGYTESSNRNATDFVNACLNYAYKICETEAMYACHVMGLHPAIGFSHGAIHEDKPALALDIIEALRPIADRAVLSFMDYGYGIPFSDDGKPAYLEKECAYELDNGVCRLYPPMTGRLATAVSMAVAPHAIDIAERIAKALTATTRISLVAPLDPRINPREPRMELAPDATAEDIIPDHLWEKIHPMIPPRRGSGIQTDPRIVLAAIVAHEIYCVSWPVAVENFPLDFRTARKRLEQWQEDGAWEPIKAEITKPGASQNRRAS